MNEQYTPIRFRNGCHRTDNGRWFVTNNIITTFNFMETLFCGLIIEGTTRSGRGVVGASDLTYVSGVCIYDIKAMLNPM